jgi:hypothetical protein
MQTLRILLIMLALSVSGCAQILDSRLSSATGSIQNENEQVVRAGIGVKRILILVDLVNESETIKSESARLGVSFYNTLSLYGYEVKQFQPVNQAERNQYLSKLETDIMRDPNLLVVRLVPSSIEMLTKVTDSSFKLPKKMKFAVYAYVGTLRSPAYMYTGDWSYDGDFLYNALTPKVTERLIKAGYLAGKSN